MQQYVINKIEGILKINQYDTVKFIIVCVSQPLIYRIVWTVWHECFFLKTDWFGERDYLYLYVIVGAHWRAFPMV